MRQGDPGEGGGKILTTMPLCIPFPAQACSLMRTRAAFISLLLAAGAVLAAASCADLGGGDAGGRAYIITVDSIQAPSEVLLGDTLVIRFWGEIGPDGCHMFDRFETSFGPEGLDVTVWGWNSGGPACPAIYVFMDGTPLGVVPPGRGLLEIRVRRPDGTALRDTVLVR